MNCLIVRAIKGIPCNDPYSIVSSRSQTIRLLTNESHIRFKRQPLVYRSTDSSYTMIHLVMLTLLRQLTTHFVCVLEHHSGRMTKRYHIDIQLSFDQN